mmetsp:Transcript_9439/g.19615  ORF Transcript_9439/g.19615 Transcript_9439/m.19615 type:complete len:118 (-) Transcript_9439:1230-1583(-)
MTRYTAIPKLPKIATASPIRARRDAASLKSRESRDREPSRLMGNAQIAAPATPIQAPKPSNTNTGIPIAAFDAMMMREAKFDKINAFAKDVISSAITNAPVTIEEQRQHSGKKNVQS